MQTAVGSYPQTPTFSTQSSGDLCLFLGFRSQTLEKQNQTPDSVGGVALPRKAGCIEKLHPGRKEGRYSREFLQSEAAMELGRMSKKLGWILAIVCGISLK